MGKYKVEISGINTSDLVCLDQKEMIELFKKMHEGDLFLAVNGSGKIGFIDYFLDQVQKTGAKVAVITGAPKERTPSQADVNVFVPAAVYKGTDPRVVWSEQPMGNLYEQHLFLLFDILVMMLEKDMGLTHDQMEARHRNVE